jgi:hypothetical protein
MKSIRVGHVLCANAIFASIQVGEPTNPSERVAMTLQPPVKFALAYAYLSSFG